MEKASVFGTKGCGFGPCQGHGFACVSENRTCKFKTKVRLSSELIYFPMKQHLEGIPVEGDPVCICLIIFLCASHGKTIKNGEKRQDAGIK